METSSWWNDGPAPAHPLAPLPHRWHGHWVAQWVSQRSCPGQMKGFIRLPFEQRKLQHIAAMPSCMWSIRSTEISSPCTLTAERWDHLEIWKNLKESERIWKNLKDFSGTIRLIQVDSGWFLQPTRPLQRLNMDQGDDGMVHGGNHLPRRQLPQRSLCLNDKCYC